MSLTIVRTFLVSILAIVFTAATVTAQVPAPQEEQQPQAPVEPYSPDDISDDDLIAFVEASDAIRPLHEEARGKIEEVIRSHDMTIERFAEIARVIHTPQEAQADISSEEQGKMEQMEQELNDIEVETRQKVVLAMAEKGLEVEEYHRIYLSVQQHSELRDRIGTLVD